MRPDPSAGPMLRSSSPFNSSLSRPGPFWPDTIPVHARAAAATARVIRMNAEVMLLKVLRFHSPQQRSKPTDRNTKREGRKEARGQAVPVERSELGTSGRLHG